MKRFILNALLLLATLTSFSQITLEHTYNYSTSVVKLETLGYKYYLMDVPYSQCRIYNMDHSLFKTINCATPNGYYLYDIKYLSENLFDADSEIELVYSYYKYVETTSSYYYIYGSRVINEIGVNEIPAIENAQYMVVNKSGDDQYKLFAYCFDYSVFPEIVWTKVYSLPGVWSKSLTADAGDAMDYIKAYPNPATDRVRVEYMLPDAVLQASLVLMDSNGRTLKNFVIDGHSDHLALDVKELPAGIYHYFIEYDQQRTASKKIVIR